MINVVIDVDTGIDDSLALIYALKKDDINVVGVVTGCGNVDARQAADNTFKVMDLLNVSGNIPVVIGADEPLEGKWKGPVANIHGQNGIGNVVLPESSRTAEPEEAEEFYLRISREYCRDLVIISLGRLTNLARVIRKYPEFTRNVKKLVMMGGTVYHSGNVTPVAEANVEGDPLACDTVFMSGLDITVVGLDVTMKARLKKEHMELLGKYCAAQNRPVVEYLQKAFDYYMEGNRLQDGCIDDCPIHDPSAILAVTAPEMFRMQWMKARVECNGTYCRGMIVTDLRNNPFEAKDICFALDVDVDAAVRELLSVFW